MNRHSDPPPEAPGSRGATSRHGASPREEAPRIPWHARPVDKVVGQLETDPERGLSTEQAHRRLEEHGPNRLPEEKGKSALVRFLEQFHNVLIYILLVAAAFTATLGEWIDTGVILAVVVINALIGFIQEGKAEQALEGIRRLLSLEATVKRDGQRRRIPAEELVPGDVVLLESGDRVPADLRLSSAKNARVEEAALTGESVPVDKSTEAMAEKALVGDRSSMAFSGTLVASGQLRGVVVATGADTEIGRIGAMVSRVQKLTTPFLEKMDAFGKQLSVAILVLASLLFLSGWLLRGYTFPELFMIAVSFAVAAIPEGLPAILTITLALGVQRMARRNAIIRRLPAVETLGSVTVICSDKTGTLTKNEMTAGRVVTAGGLYTVTGSGYAPEGEIESDGESVDPAGIPPLEELARVALLCNDSELSRDEGSGEWKLQGDPTDGGLLVLAAKAGLDRERELEAFPRLDEIPFESENRFMATLHGGPEEERWIFLKGAPEKVLEMCHRERSDDGEREIDPERWHRVAGEVADEGFRMIGLALKRVAPGHRRLELGDVQEGLTLLGLVGLMDPPRPEATEAVALCRQAGIQVKMITGDHALTARSIARQMGIGEGDDVVTGAQIEEASDEDLQALVRKHDVIARSSPEHKLRLVQALQALREVTAMTGDGVNDAPALKQADIGVAMGIKGTEAAKSASEMVLADDNFASIEKAVEEGRTIYENLKKTILFILPTNGAEALMVTSAVAFAFAHLPITPVQILWVNMITAVTLGLALAFEPMERGIMERPPRSRDEPILSGYLVWRIAFVAVIVATLSLLLFLKELANGQAPETARTMAVNVLVAGQLFYLFNSRSILGPSWHPRFLFTNRAALLAVGVLLLFQGLFTYSSLFQTWFGTAPLSLQHWLWVILAGHVVFIVVELEKALVRRRGR
jgi:magnesium-transporting ATPase (P-type)